MVADDKTRLPRLDNPKGTFKNFAKTAGGFDGLEGVNPDD